MKSKFFWPVIRNTPILLRTKKTDRRKTNEKENAWEALANKYADANVTKRTRKQLEACWKKKIKKHKNLDASDKKDRFRTDGGPPNSLSAQRKLI